MNTTTQILQGQAAAAQAVSTMQQNVEKAMKSAAEMVSFAQGNFAALTRSGEALAAGIQDMTQTVTAGTKASLEDAMHSVKAMVSAKSVRELMDLQAGLLRVTLEKAVSQASKLTDTSMKLSEQAIAPISARMSLAAEKFARAG